MITFPKTLPEARLAQGTVRAGGTDQTELRHKGIRTGPIVDLRDLAGYDTIAPTPDGGLRIGARVPIAQIAADPRVAAGWRGLAEAAGGLATPQIRARATIAGNLLQEVRCWYFRSPEFQCLKKDGASCFARSGDAEWHSVVDLGPCIAQHPSTLACALLAYDAKIEIGASDVRTVPSVLGDGGDPRKTHAIRPNEIVTAVILPPAVIGEQAAYFRTIHRAGAEWPLVECTLRVRLDADGAIAALTLALGGIANRPMRFDEVGRAAVGLSPTGNKIDDLLASLVPSTATLTQAAYKTRLIPMTAREALDRALLVPAVEVASLLPAQEIR